MKQYFTLFFLILFSCLTFSQSILISGLVVDEGGNPLPGVTVLIEGTNRGASTTFEGTYAIKADNIDQNIQFSYIGFESQSILISDQKNIDVILVESEIEYVRKSGLPKSEVPTQSVKVHVLECYKVSLGSPVSIYTESV